MTIAEIEDTLPNGFHDARLVAIEVSFQAGEANVSLLLDVSDTDARDRKLRAATLSLKGLLAFVCEGADILKGSSGEPPTISGFQPTTRQFPGFDGLSPNVKAKLFGWYVTEWNSFIFMAADQATITWTGL